jgi:3'-phosphoadenosine 5'-phosphosulfate sulfotransferase (PAPS reductase)/FAD synthetase
LLDFTAIEKMASMNVEAIVLLSLGADSVATLDLVASRFKTKLHLVHWYIYKGLSFREKLLRYYENRYDIPILQLQHPESFKLYKIDGAVPHYANIYTLMRKKLGVKWIVSGIKKSDSIQRRAMLKYLPHGIDLANQKMYPLAEWSRTQVYASNKDRKLPVSPEYNEGWHDLNFFKGQGLLWLYSNYRSDYDMIRAEYPDIEGELVRAINGEKGTA